MNEWLEAAAADYTWILGTHGGSGESKVADLSPKWLAANHRWPVGPARVILVCRTHASGLASMHAALAGWAAKKHPGVQVLAVVFIADAPGKLPAPLQQTISVLRGGAERAYRIVWSESWRLDTPNTPPPDGAHQLLRDLG